MNLRTFGGLALAFAALILVTACGQAASAADCNGNVATVSGTNISRAQFKSQLQYTLAYYEHGNPTGRYYGFNICGDETTKSVCRAVKQKLLDRMVDQQLVIDYAASHNLIPTPKEWTAALRREKTVIRNAGGREAFSAYLRKIKTDQAQFRYLENQELETANVVRTMGSAKFHHWLANQDRSNSVTRCPLTD